MGIIVPDTAKKELYQLCAKNLNSFSIDYQINKNIPRGTGASKFLGILLACMIPGIGLTDADIAQSNNIPFIDYDSKNHTATVHFKDSAYAAALYNNLKSTYHIEYIENPYKHETFGTFSAAIKFSGKDFLKLADKLHLGNEGLDIIKRYLAIEPNLLEKAHRFVMR